MTTHGNEIVLLSPEEPSVELEMLMRSVRHDHNIVFLQAPRRIAWRAALLMSLVARRANEHDHSSRRTQRQRTR